MKLFGIIFLSIGLLFALIGLGWIYALISSQTGQAFQKSGLALACSLLLDFCLPASVGAFFISLQNKKQSGNYSFEPVKNYALLSRISITILPSAE
jgi:hypothetical protein